MNCLKYSLLLLVTLAGIVNLQAQQHYSLQTCRTLALENNRKIKAAQFEMEASVAAQKSVAASAYPSVSASVLGVNLGPPLGGALDGMIPEFFVGGTVTATQVIYAGGRINNGKVAAATATEIYQEQKKMTEADVLLETEKGYWQVVQLKDKMVLATRFKEMLEVLQRDLDNSYKAGLIYKNDLLRVEVSLNEANLTITQVQDGLALAKLNLARIIGQAGQTEFTLSDSVTGDFVFSAAISQAAADNRPEIRMLQKSIEVEELQRKIIQANALPTLGVSAMGTSTVGKGVNLENGNNTMSNYIGIVSLSIPIFEWGKHTNKVKEQSFKIEAKKQQAADTRELIDMEIQQTYLLLRQSVQKVELSTRSLHQAEENLKLANDRFKAGTIVSKDVLEAQVIWQEAYSKMIDAKVDVKVNEVGYNRAIGELH